MIDFPIIHMARTASDPAAFLTNVGTLIQPTEDGISDCGRESVWSTVEAGSADDASPGGDDGGGPLICARICMPPLTVTATARIRA